MINTHLPRHFCAHGQKDKVYRRRGLIFAFDSEQTFRPSIDDANPLQWNSYSDFRSIVLLGPPRHGKSTEFAYQASQRSNFFLIELCNLNGSAELAMAFDPENLRRWNTWKKGTSPGELFIDAIDEGKLQSDHILASIVRWLTSLGIEALSRLRIHLSCRERDWGPTEAGNWAAFISNNFSEFDTTFSDGTNDKNDVRHIGHVESSSYEAPSSSKTITLSLLDLAGFAIGHYLKARNLNTEDVFTLLPHNALLLLQSPTSLEVVVDEIRDHGLNLNLASLYERICERKVQEDNMFRQPLLLGKQHINDEGKVEIGCFYSTVSLLSNRPLIGRLNFDSLKDVQAGTSSFPPSQEDEAFSTRLFSCPEFGKFRIAEPWVGDFLAARKLDSDVLNSRLRLSSLEKLIFATNGKVPYSLKGMVGWLSAFNSTFRNQLDVSDTLSSISEYMGSLTSQQKELLWGKLVAKYGDREWFDFRQYEDGIYNLACVELIPAIRLAIAPTQRNTGIRALALHVISGGLRELVPDLREIVGSTKWDIPTKIRAATTLLRLEPSEVGQFKQWLNIENDRENELLGFALSELWPSHLSISELANALRVQQKQLGGQFWQFMFELTHTVTTEQIPVLLNTFQLELHSRITSSSADNRLEKYYPSDEYAKLLIMYLRATPISDSFLDKVFQWLHAVRTAERKGISFSESKSLWIYVFENAILRRGFTFDLLKRGSQSTYNIPVDVSDGMFWQERFQENLENESLARACFGKAADATNDAKSKDDFIEWISRLASMNENALKIWDDNKFVPLSVINSDRDVFEERNRSRREARDEQKRKDFEAIRSGISDIRLGHYSLMNYLVVTHERNREDNSTEKWVEGTWGAEHAIAFREGLNAYWARGETPRFEDYEANSSPWWASVIILAVKNFLEESNDFRSCTPLLLERTLLAGIWELNNFPVWYWDAVDVDPDLAESLFMRVLKHEDGSEFPRLASRLSSNSDRPLARKVALKYLGEASNSHERTFNDLIECVVGGAMNQSDKEALWELYHRRTSQVDDDSPITILAALWQFDPERMIETLENYWIQTNKSSYERWLDHFTRLHGNRAEERWPKWVTPRYLIPLLKPLLGMLVEQMMNRGDNDSPFDKTRTLAYSALDRLVLHADAQFLDIVSAIASDPYFNLIRNQLLGYCDKMQAEITNKAWHPLTPKEIVRVINHDAAPVRTVADLYELVLDVVSEIKANIENGELHLKKLLWINDSAKPQHEEALQILLANEIKKHPRVFGQKIVCGRELEVANNFADIFVSCVLPDGKRCKVYLELKRQQHAELCTAVQNQLAAKYASDPESGCGIYVVAWYGVDEYASKATVNRSLGSIPTTALELQCALQTQCDKVVGSHGQITKMHAIVIDVVL